MRFPASTDPGLYRFRMVASSIGMAWLLAFVVGTFTLQASLDQSDELERRLHHERTAPAVPLGQQQHWFPMAFSGFGWDRHSDFE